MRKFALIMSLAGVLAACGTAKSSSPLAPEAIVVLPPATPPEPEHVAYPSNGPAVIKFVATRYPQRLKGHVSRATRLKNMKFLRDRIIEVGKCGGMDLGWNRKRGGPEISLDFITERRHGRVYGHDIAIDYENGHKPLQLYWGKGKYPSYKAFGKPTCDGR